jgi:hypothetical protein
MTVKPYQPQAPRQKNPTLNAIDEEFSNLDGPIDRTPKPAKQPVSVKYPSDKQTPEEVQGTDIFSGLHGKPIDSKK